METAKSLKNFVSKLSTGTRYSLTAITSKCMLKVDEMREEDFNYLLGHDSISKVSFSSKEDGICYGVSFSCTTTEEVVLEEGVV